MTTTIYIRNTMVLATLVITFLTLLALFPRTCSAEETQAVQPVSDSEWNDETKLWLSRSLLGEVGWRRPGEYAAVAWVYSTRAKLSKRYNFLQMIKRYSAAIRAPGKRRNPWLFELDFTSTRPPSWPDGPQWRGLHDQAWLEVLDFADEWQAGKIPNPCPGANHYGGYVDRHRAQAMRWRRVKCSVKTRNRFYNSHRLQEEVSWKERLADLRRLQGG
jgi:hypothetical protein